LPAAPDPNELGGGSDVDASFGEESKAGRCHVHAHCRSIAGRGGRWYSRICRERGKCVRERRPVGRV